MATPNRVDINSLLSPHESSVQTHPSDQHSKARRATGGGSRTQKKDGGSHVNQAAITPHHTFPYNNNNNNNNINSTSSHSSYNHYFATPPNNSPTAAHANNSNPRSSVSSPSTTSARATRTPPGPLQRHSSSHLDTLADLATMQHSHAQARQNSGPRPSELRDTHPAPQASDSAVSRLRNSSIVSTLTDHPMSETPSALLPPRDFTSTSLSQSELDKISALTKQLSENAYLYDPHIQLITLLRRGLISHVFPPGQSHEPQEPRNYSLLAELRQARLAMNARFPVGEELWIEWLQDECMLATTTEERIAVMELCQKAVQDEVGSSKIWRLYGDWMWLLYRIASGVSVSYDSTCLEEHPVVGSVLQTRSWAEEDRIVGQEIFKWEPTLEVWQQASKAVQWHINDSRLVWAPYLEIELHDLAMKPSSGKAHKMGGMFMERLRQTHVGWDETFQAFSQFVSRYDNSAYEDRMVSANSHASKAKHEMDLRQEYESELQRAEANGDRDAEWTTMSDYISWEFSQCYKKNAPNFAVDLAIGLAERANLRFPTTADFWEDHMDLVTDNPKAKYSLLDVANRATRHCPWSGSLWSRRILALEASNANFETLEDVKHHATSTGLLEELGGMEELIQVYVAWCGFLRRRAFSGKPSEDDRDIAEVGIRSAIENVKEIGEKKYGKSFKGDPGFRIERIYSKFLAHAGLFEEARKAWQQLTVTHGDQYEFWEKYYLWEMAAWGIEIGKSMGKGAAEPTPSPEPTPSHATACLQRAIRRPNLDWPEKMVDMYLHHCGQHETVHKLKEAHVEARRTLKQVAKRRAKEALQAAAVQQNAQPATYPGQPVVAREDSSAGQKRKFDSDSIVETQAASKRSRSNEVMTDAQPINESSPSHSANLKRDRENTTVVAKHLPKDVTEARVRSFFKDCGEILSISLTAEAEGAETAATIEFANTEDVLTAQTKTMKTFDGNTIDVQVGGGTILWVTNYPPEADEDYIRQLFHEFGEIVDVRFPSLKFNTHRRFCYVQFASAGQAKAAATIDGRELGKDYKLTAKISDPSVKKDKSGPLYEGREVFVSNVNWQSTEEEIRGLFDPYGTIETVRIPRKVDGKSKGIAFVVFLTKDEAVAALEMNQKEFKGRALKVEIATPGGGKASQGKSTSIINSKRSESVATDDIAVSPANEALSPGASLTSSSTDQKNYRERTLALMDVPETVNDARIRALMEPYGPLKKIVLRLDHQGAIVEFENVADMGKASLALDGYEITSGHKIRIGEVSEMLKMSAADKPAAQSFVKQGAPVRRPNQPGSSRRGGRGGLGFKKSNESSKINGTSIDDKSNGDAGGKSNADFKAMLSKD